MNENKNCPNCNCEVNEIGIDGRKKKGFRFCSECWEWIKPVKSGKGKIFLKKIKKYKEKYNE